MRHPTGSFSLYDGSMFNLLQPDPKLIRVDIVATGLSNICRYGGQLGFGMFYSVAEHSVRVAEQVAKLRPDLAMAALMHDAPEGLGMGDCITPLKVLLPTYPLIEAGVQQAVEQAFCIPEGACNAAPIKMADFRMYVTEQLVIRKRPREAELLDVEPYDDVLFQLHRPSDAYEAFMDAFYHYCRLGG